MLHTDPLTAARGYLAGLLDQPTELPGDAPLDVCDALNHLQLPGTLPDYPDRPPDRRDPAELLRAARAVIVLALPKLPDAATAVTVARALPRIDSALATLDAR